MRHFSLAVLLFTLAGAEVARGDLEDQLEGIWRGSSVLTRIDTRSACGAFFTDNEVAERVAVGGGSHRFEAAELASRLRP